MRNLIRKGDGGEGRTEVLPRWDPYRIMRDMLRWEPFDGGFGLQGGEGLFNPQWEVMERKDAYVFKADLPGIKEEALDISLTGNRLTVSGKREAEEREEGATYYAFERTYGSFSRTFSLPDGVDADHVTADLKHGELTIIVPKKPEVQPKRISLKPGLAAGKTEKDKAKA